LHARTALGVALSSTLAACMSAAPHGAAAPPEHQPGTAPDAQPADAAYDWHGLMAAPFGSMLKDMPVALHEVLLFRDEAHAATEAEEQDCYAQNGPAPSFAGQKLDEYLLCFKHDRLWRIGAAVRLPADNAAQVFSQMCATWLQKAAPAGPEDRLLPAAGGCDGRAGGVGFSAQLGPESNVESSDTDVRLSITLYSAADRDAERGIQ
jgi:hypothetical protein